MNTCTRNLYFYTVFYDNCPGLACINLTDYKVRRIMPQKRERTCAQNLKLESLHPPTHPPPRKNETIECKVYVSQGTIPVNILLRPLWVRTTFYRIIFSGTAGQY